MLLGLVVLGFLESNCGRNLESDIDKATLDQVASEAR